MAEKAGNQKQRQSELSRRDLLVPLLGITALPIISRVARAENRDHPPVFATARTQFTLMEPAIQLPDTMLNDQRGKAVKLSRSPGKVMLINIWATWCQACRTELPLLQKLHETAGDKVSIAAISTEKLAPAQITSFLAAIGVKSLPVYLDPDEKLASNSTAGKAPLATFSMPLTYLVTPSGRIAGYIAGAADWLSADATRLLKYYATA